MNLTLDQIICSGYSFPSRQDKTALRIVNALITMGIFEPGYVRRPFSGVLSFEVEQAASALGFDLNPKNIERVKTMVFRLEGKGLISRTDAGVRSARGYFEAGEDFATSGAQDDHQYFPLADVTVSEVSLDCVADQYENAMLHDSERLRVLDLSYGCRRIVRQILLIAGAKLSASFVGQHPVSMRFSFLQERVVGEGAVRACAAVLQKHIEEDERFTAPLERFWRVSEFVLEFLGAAVEADLDAMFSQQNEAQEPPTVSPFASSIPF